MGNVSQSNTSVNSDESLDEETRRKLNCGIVRDQSKLFSNFEKESYFSFSSLQVFDWFKVIPDKPITLRERCAMALKVSVS